MATRREKRLHESKKKTKAERCGRQNRLVNGTSGAAGVVRATLSEVGVHAGLLRGQTVSRVILQKSFQQSSTSLLKTGDKRSIGALPLRESRLVVGERGDTGPCFLVGGTQDTRRILA